MADYEYINNQGVIVPDTDSILSEVQQDYKDSFGEDLIVTPDTPQGVLITGETIARSEVVNNNAALANQINPNIAGGVFLDAISALSGLYREKSTRSLVTAQLTGVASTIIPTGSKAKTADGDIFETISSVVLNSLGEGEVVFRAVEYGAIPCLAGELSIIFTGVLGWETITNADGAILGTEEQSDEAFRALRKNTLSLQGVALPSAMSSALYATEGVKSISFRENIADTTETIDGVSMLPHSIFACVDGGSDLDVAAALLENKSSGSNWNGTTTQPIEDPSSNQTYNVKFYRPDEIGILIQATVKNANEQDVIDAILAYANGEISGETGFVVGADVSPFEIAGAININFPSIYVKKLEISLTSPVSYVTSEIEISLLEKAFTQESYITVIIE